MYSFLFSNTQPTADVVLVWCTLLLVIIYIRSTSDIGTVVYVPITVTTVFKKATSGDGGKAEVLQISECDSEKAVTRESHAMGAKA